MRRFVLVCAVIAGICCGCEMFQMPQEQPNAVPPPQTYHQSIMGH
jgi:hypothetical protein